MIISKGHKLFAKFINLLQVIDRDDAIRLIDEQHPDTSGVTVLALVGREDWRQVQLWYSAENCYLVWNDAEGNYCEQQLDDMPLAVGRVASYLEGMTSELTFPKEA